MSDCGLYVYSNKEFSHGLRCGVCDWLFSEGEYYTEVRDENGDYLLVCTQCREKSAER